MRKWFKKGLGILFTSMMFFGGISACDKIPNHGFSSSSTIPNEELSAQEEIYQLALKSGYEGTYEDWLKTIRGEKVSLSIIEGVLCWKYETETDWKVLLNLTSLSGDDGREVEFNVSLTHIQWRYVGEEEYKDLVALEDLKGKDGQNGTNGTNGLSAYEIAVELGFEGDEVAWLTSLQGTKGEDGREVEFNVSLTHIQWRYVGEEEYRDLIPLSSLQGDSGLSAYEIYLKYHPEYEGSEEDWINDLVSGKLNNDNNGENEDDLNVYEGNDYLFNFIGDVASISLYIGNDLEIVIPTKVKHNGRIYDVVEIEKYAFSGKVNKLTIPCEVYIEPGAFDNLSVEDLILEEGIEYIKPGTLPNMLNLYLPKSLIAMNSSSSSSSAQNLYYAGTVEDWNNIIFFDNSNPLLYGYVNFYMLNEYKEWELLTDVTIPGSIKEIKGYLFGRYQNLINVVVEYGVETIKSQAFRHIDNVLLPSSIKNIENLSFVGGITNLYYDGLAEELMSINGYENLVVTNTYVRNEQGEWVSLKEGVPNTGKTIQLVLSGPADWNDLNLELIEDFKKSMAASGDTNVYEIQYVHYDENTINSELLNWGEGPDVYAFTADNIDELYKKGVLAKLTNDNLTYVTDNMVDFAIEASTFMDGVYAYPMTADNTYYLQYDASILTAAQVENIEDILDAAYELGKKVSYNLPEAYWGGAAMFTFGADYNIVYDADGNVERIEADFGSEAGVKAAKAIYKIISHPAWTKDQAAPDAIACLDGTWAIDQYKERFGDNYACAAMPKVTVDGETKNLGAFVGCKLLGVNPHRAGVDHDRLTAAHKLAQYLTSTEAQLKRYQVKGNVPCHMTALEDPDLATDPNVFALNEHHKYATVQTPVPDAFWTAPGKLVQSMLATDPAFVASDENFRSVCKELENSIRYPTPEVDEPDIEEEIKILTVEEAITYMQSASWQSGEILHVIGVITSEVKLSSYGGYSFYLGDNFQVYSAYLDSSLTVVPEIGDTITVQGPSTIRNGIYEVSYTNSISPLIYKIEKTDVPPVEEIETKKLYFQNNFSSNSASFEAVAKDGTTATNGITSLENGNIYSMDVPVDVVLLYLETTSDEGYMQTTIILSNKEEYNTIILEQDSIWYGIYANGTVEKTLQVSAMTTDEAIEYMQYAVWQENDILSVYGKVTEVSYSETYKNWTLVLDNKFHIYSIYIMEGINEIPEVQDTVYVSGTTKILNGEYAIKYNRDNIIYLIEKAEGNNGLPPEEEIPDVEEEIPGTPVLDFSTKEVAHSTYTEAWTYGGWTISGGANNGASFDYIRIGGSAANIERYNDYYIASGEIKSAVSKVTVNLVDGSLKSSEMAVIEWGVYVYSDSEMTTQIDYVKGGEITSSAASFEFIPSEGTSWAANSYYKVVFELSNVGTRNGIVYVGSVILEEKSDEVVEEIVESV